MATKRHKYIAEMMNGLCSDRTFSANEVAIIERQIKVEWVHRKRSKRLKLNTRTKQGKIELNNRIATTINTDIKPRIPITEKHIRLYKQCREDEYSERTGKCAWGFKEMRERLGYDPDTGFELMW